MESADLNSMEGLIKRLSLFKKPDLDNVEQITSAEYYYDPQCHLSAHEQIMNDYETLETFKGWIEENPHIIKVRDCSTVSIFCVVCNFLPYF